MKYTIRKPTVKDSIGMARVHVQAWHETYTGIVGDDYLQSLNVKTRAQKWRESLAEKNSDRAVFVAEDEKGKIVGIISGGKSQDKRFPKFQAELFAIYILKKHQGNKLGLRLTKKLVSVFQKQGIKNMFVCVLKQNDSKHFYMKYGAKFLKNGRMKIGTKMFTLEYYGWKNFDKFLN